MNEELSCGVQLKYNDKPNCELEGHALLRIDGTELIIRVRLADRGQYAIKLYAKEGENPGRLDNVCNYLIRHAGPAAVPPNFPTIHDDQLGKRFINCDHFHIQAVSHIDDIVYTDQAQVVFRFATP
ncbi:hypothetical protein LSH36_18g05055 [Paralvinella palmiformis]|uniref:KY-like immunoglobulin-like domain-containing protein n=1 Tax=Paralvinella palmiformis TaxID=53620 RepID=A0AAD9KBI6_9ANNE|nr:hypothetical protein LSH36_18g05055 [Paralvinella palmiformis]